MLQSIVRVLNTIVVGGAFVLAGIFIISIWMESASFFEIPGVLQMIWTYLVILGVFGIVRRAASLERLARPRVKDNGLTPPDGTND